MKLPFSLPSWDRAYQGLRSGYMRLPEIPAAMRRFFFKNGLPGGLTYTPLMAFRATPLVAPLAVMVPVQGKADGTAGDVLSYGRGTQISGNNYDCANTYQGTRIVLVEPLYAGADGKRHYIWNGGSFYYFMKTEGNNIQSGGYVTGTTPVAYTPTISTPLTRNLLASRYDNDNPVSGSSVIDLWVNGAQTLGVTSASAPMSPSVTTYLFSANGANAGHLGYYAWEFDDLWSDSQIAALGDGTTPVSPDRVMPNPECLKLGWSPGLRAASGSFTGSLVAEGFFWNWRPYNASTNPNGDLLAGIGMGETDAHLAAWTPVNAALVRAGAARSFNGTTQYMRDAVHGISPGVGDFTVSAWVYLTNTAGDAFAISSGTPATGFDGFRLGTYNGRLRAIISEAGGGDPVSVFSNTGSIAVAGWYHLLVTFDRNGNATPYVNGAANGPAVNIAAHAGSIDCSTLYLANSGATFFPGRIARVKYWSRLVTAGEIAADYNAGKGLFYAECAATAGMRTGLDYAWDLDESSGNAVAEVGGITLTDNGSCGTAAGPDVADMAGMADTSCLKLIATTAADGDAYKDVALAAGTSVYLSGWGKKHTSDTGAQLRVWSGTSGSEETTLLFDSTVATDAVPTADKASGCVVVAAGHDRLRFKMTADTGTAGTAALFDNVGAWLNLVANGGFEGTFAKTGSALTTSTAATSTVTDLGSGSYRVVDSTTWDLSLARVGMIGEWHDGSGFLTTVTDASDLIEVGEITGNPPTTGDAVAVYSAIAPGWAATGSPRLFRTTGRSGTYAQGVIGAAANDGITQSVTVANTTWHMLVAQINPTSGTSRLQTTSGAAANGVDTTAGTGAYEQVSCAVRSSATTLVVQAVAATAGTFAVDDVICVPLSSVTLTATPWATPQDTNGWVMQGGSTNTIPGAGVLNASEGTIIVKFTPKGWNGADGRAHYLLDTTAGAGRIELWKDSTNTIGARITDATGTTLAKTVAVNATNLPDGTAAVLGIRYGAAGMAGALGTTALSTSTGAGTGVPGSVSASVAVGHAITNISQADSAIESILTFNQDIGSARLAELMASL